MFPVELCPEVMGNFGLAKGRRLMEIWFSRPPAVAPRYSTPVTNVITMDWVLKLPRAKNVYDKLMADFIWAKHAALIEVGRALQRKGLLADFHGSKTFGDLGGPVAELDDDYINQRTIAGYQGVDDLTAALGAFEFRVVVAGSVQPVRIISRGQTLLRHDVTIKEIGVYVRDSYDFEGDQFLGWWTYPDRYEYWRSDFVDDGRSSRHYPFGYVFGMPFEGGELITNEEFKKFRNKRHKGGDFLVYSDLKRNPVYMKFNTDELIGMHGNDVFNPTSRDLIKAFAKIGGATL